LLQSGALLLIRRKQSLRRTEPLRFHADAAKFPCARKLWRMRMQLQRDAHAAFAACGKNFCSVRTDLRQHLLYFFNDFANFTKFSIFANKFLLTINNNYHERNSGIYQKK
jgi:hypothetical protein